MASGNESVMSDRCNGSGRSLTGQTPLAMMRSKDKASGMPADELELPDVMESLIDFCFSSPLIEALEEEVTCEGRR